MSIDKIVSLCKRRGFIFQSSDIYGGFKAVYDYGPLGIALKNNISQIWWKAMTQIHENIVGLDSAILMHPKIWEASGHVGAFNDPLVDCRQCKARFRADELTLDKQPNLDEMNCPKCGTKGSLTEPRQFNLMFKTHIGPVQDDSSIAYLRPETAQGIYVNYLLVQNAMRLKLPFGIAQVGKAFRNEIVARNFIFRTREFEQMEMEYFVPPEEAGKWFEYWCEERMNWYLDLGIPEEKIRLRPHDADELSHYSSGTSDIEFMFPWGWGELEGVANRGDYDLKQHSDHSGEKLTYFDPNLGEHYVPHVIEPAAGATRSMMAFLLAAYDEETVNDDLRTVLRFDERIAPYKVAILPLSKKDTLTPIAQGVFDLVKAKWMTDYDETQNIGKRYRRQDELGTPYCVTIDFDTIDDKAVTIRDRDTMQQDRIAIDQLVTYLGDRLT